MLPAGVKTGDEFRCPECGRIYETEVPFCTGTKEPGQFHAPVNVQNYKEAAQAHIDILNESEDKKDKQAASDFSDDLAALSSE